MKIRCAHLTVQLVVRQGRDVKGNSPFIIEVAPRYQRPHTDGFLCVGVFYPSFCLSFVRELSRFDELILNENQRAN